MTKYLPTFKELAIYVLVGIALGVVTALIGSVTGVRGDVYRMAVTGFVGAVVAAVHVMRRNRRAP